VQKPEPNDAAAISAATPHDSDIPRNTLNSAPTTNSDDITRYGPKRSINGPMMKAPTMPAANDASVAMIATC